MRLSTVLFQQHIGRMFRDHWRVQGKRLVIDNGALNAVQQRGLDFEDVEEFIKSENAITNEMYVFIMLLLQGNLNINLYYFTFPLFT